jgi:3',5'-cyclic AMP phosphodiesterase CpdA
LRNILSLVGIALVAGVLLVACSGGANEKGVSSRGAGWSPLTIIAIGDAGEKGSDLRANASYLTDMHTGRHDGGQYAAMIFLGDNFYNTGLNIPSGDVRGKIDDILGPFKLPFEALGRENVHAIAGNHDWYTGNALETSILFGLIKIAEGPIGLSDRGNKRAAEIPWWTYYYEMPAQVVYPLSDSAADSVQFVFFDSALPLRIDPAAWHPALDSLRRVLTASAARTGVTWRILVTHHPFYSLGPHGGYAVWNDEANTVEYVSRCDKDTNAVGWFKNMIDPEDLCAEKYRMMMDSIKTVVHRSGAHLQLTLAGHEHSMQLLYYPERDLQYTGWPTVHVISGAGSKPARVRFPNPPHEFTSAQTKPGKEGYSVPGFAQLRFEGKKLRIVFFDGTNGDMIDMGGGRKEFWIDVSGTLLN